MSPQPNGGLDQLVEADRHREIVAEMITVPAALGHEIMIAPGHELVRAGKTDRGGPFAKRPPQPVFLNVRVQARGP
jgi:hypothetical protein